MKQRFIDAFVCIMIMHKFHYVSWVPWRYTHTGQKKAVGSLQNKSKPDCNLQIFIIHKVIKYEHFSRIHRLSKSISISEIGEQSLFTLRWIPDTLATWKDLSKWKQILLNMPSVTREMKIRKLLNCIDVYEDKT